MLGFIIGFPKGVAVWAGSTPSGKWTHQWRLYSAVYHESMLIQALSWGVCNAINSPHLTSGTMTTKTKSSSVNFLNSSSYSSTLLDCPHKLEALFERVVSIITLTHDKMTFPFTRWSLKCSILGFKYCLSLKEVAGFCHRYMRFERIRPVIRSSCKLWNERESRMKI